MSKLFIPLTGAQKNVLHNAVASPPVAPNFARSGEANPNLRIAVVNFDGTGNDRDNLPDGSRATLIAETFEAFRDQGDPHVSSYYQKGVGTTKSKVGRLIESAFGNGCEDNAEKAHEALTEQVDAWRKENPNLQVHVHVTGFSRGSATALHFLNLVHERGLTLAMDDGIDVPETMQPTRVQTSAVLLDTVSTGQGLNLDLTVPSSCVALLHLTAANEQRHFFPLREIAKGADQEISFAMNAHMDGASLTPDGMVCYRRIQEVELPGAHSDVGGSYAGGGVRDVSKFLMENFQASLGLNVQPRKPSTEHIQNCGLHDSLKDWRMESFLVGHTDNDMDALSRKRAVQEAQRDNWDGMIIERFSVTDAGGEVAKSMDTGQIDLKTDDPLRHWVGRPVDAVLRPEGTGEDMRIVLKTDCPDECELSGGKLFILGRRVKGLPSESQMKAAWRQQIEAGEEPKPLHAMLEIHRLGTIAQTTQVFDATPPTPIPEAKDPWPSDIRGPIQYLNSDPKPSLNLANSLMNRSQRAIANALQAEFPDIERVTLTPQTVLENNVDGRRFVNTFVMKAERSDGTSFSSDMHASGKADFELSNRMRELRRGLSEVSEGLLRAGFKPAKGAQQSFERDAPPASRQMTMCSLDEPGPPAMRMSPGFMKMMGNLVTENAKERKKEDMDRIRNARI